MFLEDIRGIEWYGCVCVGDLILLVCRKSVYIYYKDILYKEAPMSKLGKQKINDLLLEMSHYDPDNMEMAAKRLSQLIISGEINLDADPNAANSVRQAFMKQIQSENDTVQSEAIKYLADIVPKLPHIQIQSIFERILDFIINLNLVEKKRQRYGVCAASVIHQAADEHGNKLQNLFLKSIVKLLEFKDKKNEVEIILISIITEFIKKWPIVASKLVFNRKNLIIYLLKNIQIKSKLDIIKKSQVCLGKLSYILDKQLLNVIIQDKQWGLLTFLSSNQAKRNVVDNLKHLRNGLLTLNQIVKTRNIEMRYFVKNMVKIYLSVITSFKDYQEIDNIELICDILESSLTGLSLIIKTFHKEMKDVLENKNSPLYGFVVILLDFNVEGMMSYAGQAMEIETSYQEDEQYYEEAQVDEKCWKVRRAALFYISTLAKYDKTFLNMLGQSDLIKQLGNKFVQEHSMVSEMAFQTFNQLINIISVDRASYNTTDIQLQELSMQRVKSSAVSIAENIINEISTRTRIVFRNSKFNDQLKIQSSKILLRMIEIYHHILVSNQNDTFNLITFLVEEVKKTAILENKCTLILCLKELISKDYKFSSYTKIHELLFEQINKVNNVKLHNVCITTFKKFNETFVEEISNSGYLNKIIQLLKNKIKEFDSDKLLKTAVVKCLRSLLSNYVLPEQELVYFLQMLFAKLKIEIQKIYIIQAVIRIKSNNTLSNEKVKILQNLVKQISENIGNKNYELNVKSIEAINEILQSLNQKVSNQVLQQLLVKSKSYLNEGKIPSFFNFIMIHQSKLLKPYAELIVKSTQSQFIIGLIQNNIIDVSHTIQILKTADLGEKNKKISQTIGVLNMKEEIIFKEIDETSWGRIMLGSLGYIGNENTISRLFEIIDKTLIDETRFEACGAIGNIASKNQDKYVPQLIQRAKKASDLYIYIYIFKEMLNFNENNFSQSGQLIDWLLAKSQNKFEAQSNYYITSQCIGKLAFISQSNAQLVINNSKSNNENRRLIIANSLRFGLQNRIHKEFSFLDHYIKTIVELFNDLSVKVREGAAKSLLYLSQADVKKLKPYLTEQFLWKSVQTHACIHNELIVVIDYGACKQIKDQGKNLRLQTFNLLQNLVTKSHIQGALIEELMKTCLHRINEQTANDIIVKRLIILKELCKIDYSYFARLEELFVKMINLTDGIFKNYKTKIDDERIEIYIKGSLREILQIYAITKEQNFDRINSLIIDLRANPLLNGLIDSLEKHK